MDSDVSTSVGRQIGISIPTAPRLLISVLICRYAEGTQVLYSTKFIILTEEKRWEVPGNTMVGQLCAERPPQRLASITHLVLIWEILKPPRIKNHPLSYYSFLIFLSL
jgi:hypothetical protein